MLNFISRFENTRYELLPISKKQKFIVAIRAVESLFKFRFTLDETTRVTRVPPPPLFRYPLIPRRKNEMNRQQLNSGAKILFASGINFVK